MDTIYLSHDTRELCLRDFDHLDQKYSYLFDSIISFSIELFYLRSVFFLFFCFRDIVPIISALEYNTWFTKFRASNIKLTHESLDRILHIMKKSLSIEELYLDNLGVKW